jgi:NAD(P)-dependent dehydrogenase (short-subunit alcohol dehydrogenase family)
MNLELRLAGRTALVLGGGAEGPPRAGENLPMGNGRAISIQLGLDGAAVAVVDRSSERAEQTVAELAHGGVAITADAADPVQCRDAVAQAESALGSVDIVVLNAAVSGNLPLRAQTLDDWELQMAVNARGSYVVAQAALDGMLERGRGSFVIVSSSAAVLSSGRSLAYEASKAAQLALMRHIAVRYAQRGIRANAVVLGLIDSTMVRRMFGDSVEQQAQRASVVPMGREGHPEEVGQLVSFLASDDSAYINGVSIPIDGGVSAKWPTPSVPQREQGR